MAILLTGLLIGLCLAFAGGITVLLTAFKKIPLHGLSDGPTEQTNRLFHTLVLQQDKVISSLMVGYAFFVLSAIILITHYLLAGLNWWQLGLHCLLLPFFILILTEALPRAYMLRQSNDFALQMTGWIRGVYLIFHFPAKFIVWITAFFKNGFQPLQNLFSTGEYYTLTKRYFENNLVSDTPEKQDYRIQQSLVRFAAVPVVDMIIPLKELKMMDAAMPVDELLENVFSGEAKRILLYQDGPENIVGILHKSLLMKSFCLAEGDKEATDITSAISEPVFISEHISVLEQLQNFSIQQGQFALVKDGDRIKGAIDLETILEALSKELSREGR